MFRHVVHFITVVGCGFSTGCGDVETSSPRTDTKYEIPTVNEPAGGRDLEPSADELRDQLGANENARFEKVAGRIRSARLFDSGATNLNALEGLDLWVLELDGLKVDDLAFARGMPLRKLHMRKADVSDIGALEGMELEELNLMGTGVKDVGVLRTMKVGTLWIPDTSVDDLGPLAGRDLVSLDVANTPVADLSPLAGMASLKRLNIAGSNVTDLTPLRGLRLERLLFTPSKIKKGLDAVREMNTLRELGTSFEDRQGPARFWAAFDAAGGKL